MEEKKPLKSNFKENPDNLFDTEMRLKALEGAETSHKTKIAEEERMGVPSHDESMVSDWIRHRIDVPKDMIKGRGVFKVEAARQPEGDYEADLKKLKALTSDELNKLLIDLVAKSKEGRGLFSKGALLNGYAIDRETLQSLQSVHHDGVGFELATKIAGQLTESGDPKSSDIDKILGRIVEGFVYMEVPGFKTPIVKLYLGTEKMGNLVPKEAVRKIVNRMKDERKLLPISSDFRVL